jgi:short-subunit dehydrogenase
MKKIKQKTVLITGASSGIGYSLAHEFANHKYNLVLVARDETRLLELKEECEKKYKIAAWVIACDLSQIDSSIHTIQKTIQNLRINIDVLVNNAGFGVHGEFSKTNLDKEIDMVNLQTVSILTLTKLFLPYMIKNKDGGILNVGSVYSYIPVPYQSVYAACKSFILSFSLSLAHEVKESGVKVTALCPGSTQTEFRLRSKLKSIENNSNLLKGMTADEVAKQAFNAFIKGKLICIPGSTNKFLVSFSSLLPSNILSSLTSYINEKRGVNHS